MIITETITIAHIADNLAKYNAQLKDLTPEQIIDWALQVTDNRVVTTSFGVYSAVLLSTFSKQEPCIPVLWCDTRYNNQATYEHASRLIRLYDLNVYKYESLQPQSYTDAIYSKVANVEGDHHAHFSEVVKLEPFRRAMRQHAPDLWFTNIRVRQTAYRSNRDILSFTKTGILKVSPFYYWTDADLDQYIIDNDLRKNSTYFDPVKALANRECGIHLQ